MRDPLPIDEHLPRILEVALEAHRVVVEAPTGSGKTTRLPWALAEALDEAGAPREVWVLEPRRLAARLAARFVATSIGEAPGERVGYEVRFERRVSRRTRVRYLTEALLARHLLETPDLPGVGAVLLDEFHERHLHTDLALVLLTRLQETRRPDLIAGVLSATLEGVDLSRTWPDAPRVVSKGRTYPVTLEHLDRDDPRPLHERVLGALRRIAREGEAGQVLCFLPGAGAIERCARALSASSLSETFEVARLHGELSARAQDAALRPSGRPRVILSTNVAESSVTVPGVTVVIDSGLARLPAFDPWLGLPRLMETKVSRAALTQRAGRAGRVAPGRCLRLFTEHDARSRPAQHPPEIQRAELSGLRLLLATLVDDPEALPWPAPPPAAAWEAAGTLLRRLRLLGDDGEPTEDGRRVASWPIAPRLARLLLDTARAGEPEAGARLVALLSERDVLARGPFDERRPLPSGSSDPLDRLERLEAAEAAGLSSEALRHQALDRHRTSQVLKVAQRLARLATPVAGDRPPQGERETILQRALLGAWPDRVAARRAPRSERFVLAAGGEVVAGPETVVRDHDLIVAIEARKEAQGRAPRLRVASAIEAEWLIDLDPEGIEERVEVEWDARRERVFAFERLRYGAVVLAESRCNAAGQPKTARLLARALREQGLSALDARGTLEPLLARLEILARLDPDLDLPDLGSEDGLWALVEAACQGASSLAEVRERDFAAEVRARLSQKVRARLDAWLPATIALPGRRRAPIHYARGQTPYVASRLQDFFGLGETPHLAGGRLRLQVRLLAPNGRPVQITQDLEGFWTRHYPQVRRELRGRYPKHAWPEDPGAA